MLEIKNLTKIYKTKGGVETRALDDVSLSFPERGMVFLLGKSGSGKSTLLNVCGGLDAPTSGEIIVKGRSSADFTQSDFDSYRNTFIGFIFQEYNILNEFSVEDNIALALELQGKPKDKAAVAALLEQVDLAGYAKRKPDTLSGGQKQRIAIARALIKSPEIIMADEPTGALDSNTGRQVFETLKKLSRDKLVIIVSHDRDFAEQYGDRIIELKDGKILSDVTKTVEEQKALSTNVTAIGQTLCIKNGAALTETDFAEIKSFLRGSEGDVVITGGEREVQAFREISRITDDGGQEVFRDTDNRAVAAEKRRYTPEDSTFIRSRLPLRHAAKIGLSGLKSKPIRLCFTTLLCTIAFVLFGLLSTLTFYDSAAAFRETMLDTEPGFIQLGKRYRSLEITYEYGEKTREYESTGNKANMSLTDVERLAEMLGAKGFAALSTFADISAQQNSAYWNNSINYVASAKNAQETIGALKHGRMPEKTDEIVISTYQAEAMMNTKARVDDNENLDVDSIDKILGKTINVNIAYDVSTFKIVGIFETLSVPARFEPLKENASDASLREELEAWLADGTMQLVLVHDDLIASVARNYNYMSGGYTPFERHYLCIADTKSETGDYVFSDNLYQNGQYAAISEADPSTVRYFTAGKTAPSGNEIVLNERSYFERVRHALDGKSIELPDYGRDKLNSEIWQIQEDNFIRSSFSYVNNWVEHLRAYSNVLDAEIPTDQPAIYLSGIFEAFKAEAGTFTDYEAEVFNAPSLIALTRAGLLELGDPDDASTDEKIDRWLRYLSGDLGQEDSLPDPANTAEYRLYDDLRKTYEWNPEAIYNRVIVNKYAKLIEEETALGVFRDPNQLLDLWEETYADGKPEGTLACYDDVYETFRTRYAERYSAELLQKEQEKLFSALNALIDNYYYTEKGEYETPTEEYLEAARERVLEYCATQPPVTIRAQLYSGEGSTVFGDVMTYTVVGIFDEGEDHSSYRMYLPDDAANAMWAEQIKTFQWHNEIESNYSQTADEIYSCAFFTYDGSAEAAEKLTGIYTERESYGENDTSYVMTGTIAMTFEQVDDMVSQFSKIFLYVGLGMAVFAALLLSNFISVSISNKRREIGILRAVGARSIDVFKIFFSESFFITAVCVVISLVGSFVICGVVNSLLVDMLGASLFVFGIFSVLILIGVALLTALVATFLPVYNAAKRRPVESIRAL